FPNDFGFYGQGGVYIIRERLELAARVSGTLLSNRAAVAGLVNPLPGNTVEYTGGLNVYLFGHGAKLQTDYTLVAAGPLLDPNAPNVSTLFVNTANTHRFRVQLQLLF